jgi:endonuclease/exonuclease/phosphatase family metal-dependent hydrolase
MIDPNNAPLRVATWNVHSGIGQDGAYDLDRVISFIQRHDPDIVALQEIDSRGRPGHLPLDQLKAVLGPHAAEAKTIIAEDGDYGHVLISRWPIEHVVIHDLSVGRREPRHLLEATISTPGGNITVGAVHLGFHITEIRQQLRRISAVAKDAQGAFLMIGDFNDWHRQVRRQMRKLGLGWTNLNTFPAFRPFLSLDGIFAKPAGSLVRFWTDAEARIGSDHLPVFADVRF